MSADRERAPGAADHRLWPGKTLHPEPGGPSWHPATFHCLDVAAVADCLLLRNAAWCRRIARIIDADERATRSLLVRLVALHDIGKLTRGFCEMVGHELPVPARHRATTLRHWEASHVLLTGKLRGAVATLLCTDSRGARRQLCAAVSGHHGRPPSRETSRYEDHDGVPAALAFANELAELIPGGGVPEIDSAVAARLSWTVAGLTVLADWVGSNPTWFPYASHETPTAEYWERARRSAEVAVREAGLGGSDVAPAATLGSLFDIDAPRPMQVAAAGLEIGDEPTMVVIEDATGSGKTESAVLLAQRMMVRGHGEGVYVALPTMATANAMFERLGESYRRLFAEGSRPSLALAHGKRSLDPGFAEAVAAGLRAVRAEEGARDGRAIEDTEVAAFCSAWIADDRRKTFNAEVGVGTIDQAFLGVLPVRFSVLRLVGLARRVLIVDEAHACDPYMEAELCRLLQMQATLGGSAIVMTATLTQGLREKLVAAYRLGLGVEASDFAPSAPYPSVTVARADPAGCLDLGVAPCAATTRRLPVERLDSVDAAIERIVESAKAGAAVAWVRNTVDDVIDGHDRVAAALEEVEGTGVELFHARFAMADRLKVERRVLERYGRKAPHEDRRGRVLVASQVVEASLDLDFDVMVSDLAPVDSLIQRAGRLWRHLDLRLPEKRPVGDAVLHVLSPDPDAADGDGWGKNRLGGSGYVYGRSVLWRSARALFDAGHIDAPEGLRDLLEAVVGNARPDVPPALRQDENALLGRDYADAARSRANAVRPADGYEKSAVQGTDASFPTRADTDGCRVVLVRRDGDDIVPWVEDDPTAALSEIGLRRYRYEKLVELGGAPAEDRLPDFATEWPAWRRETLAMLVVGPDGSIGTGARYDRVGGLRNVPETGVGAPSG